MVQLCLRALVLPFEGVACTRGVVSRHRSCSRVVGVIIADDQSIDGVGERRNALSWLHSCRHTFCPSVDDLLEVDEVGTDYQFLLEGTTVKRASLCNISECERLGLGNKGSRLSVIKANKIIPKVIQVVEAVGTFEIPKTCPVCDAPTVVRESEVSGTRTLHCTNPDCPAKQLKKFARFVSKEGVNIDGLSEQTLQKFINLGWVREYSDLFHISQHANVLRDMEGFGTKSVTNLLAATEKARQVEARRLLFALNIPLVGQDVCTRLLTAYPLEELIQTARNTQDDAVFASISGIGPEKSTSFVRWMKDCRHAEMLDHLLPELEITQPDSTPSGTRCQGLTFVVTGDVHHYKNRNELKAYIQSQGGKVTGSVSKSTSFLINNDVTSTSSKNAKAQQLGIPIISEDEFIERFSDQES